MRVPVGALFFCPTIPIQLLACSCPSLTYLSPGVIFKGPWCLPLLTSNGKCQNRLVKEQMDLGFVFSLWLLRFFLSWEIPNSDQYCLGKLQSVTPTVHNQFQLCNL